MPIASSLTERALSLIIFIENTKGNDQAAKRRCFSFSEKKKFSTSCFAKIYNNDVLSAVLVFFMNMAFQSNIVALISAQWASQVTIWRVKVGSVPSFLLIDLLQLGHHEVDQNNGNSSEQRRVLFLEPFSTEHDRYEEQANESDGNGYDPSFQAVLLSVSS